MLRNVPGRKTDLLDCQWLQLLHRRGLLQGSFRPRDAVCRLRALQRQRASLLESRTRCTQWMQKALDQMALDQMNIRVHRAVSDLTGKTGMAIVRAIVAGERDPLRLAALRDRGCKNSVETIAEHLTGTWREEHLFNLTMSLRLFDEIERSIAESDERILQELEPLQSDERRDETLPPHPKPEKERKLRKRGGQKLREALWRFAGVEHFVSWLRLCPRTAISGGKPLAKRRNGMGSSRVAAVLRMAATTVQRSKTALGAAFRSVARQKGAAVAVFAIARKLAQYLYRLLRPGRPYVDIGEAQYEARYQRRRLAALSENAKELGFTLIPKPAT